MYNPESRIYFLDNPYPNGHKLKAFEWSIRLIPSKGLWFDLHLETENYYTEDKTDDETDPESDWNAKIVWGNYHSCRMSSNHWHAGGFLGGSQNKKFNFKEKIENRFHVDPLPRQENFDPNEDPPFCMYLLGHDDCADHQIVFQNEGSNHFKIKWEGKIALSYSGDYDFNHHFITEIKDVQIPEILCPSELTDQEIENLLSKCSIGFEGVQIVRYEATENIDNSINTTTTDLEMNKKSGDKSNFWSNFKRLWS